jgi:hypothetical protein
MSDQQNLDPKPGIYTARAVKGSEQYGESTNGSPELLLQLDIPDIGKRLTTVLYFSAAAAPYSIERLRAMGWEGSDLSDLTGIDKKDVSIEITYEPFEGELKMKVQVRSGGGTFNTKKPVDAKAFAARVGAIAGLPTTPASAAAPKPKF